MKRSILLVTALAASACHAIDGAEIPPADQSAAQQPLTTGQTMDKGTLQLGNFSVSLTVKDLAKSRTFYEALGFVQVGGEPAQNWIVLQNGATKVGLFQGMFERNLLTFNPGWDNAAKPLEQFTDVREIQRHLEQQGLTLVMRADPATTGPASLIVNDPDGNPVLIDQHVPAPAAPPSK